MGPDRQRGKNVIRKKHRLETPTQEKKSNLNADTDYISSGVAFNQEKLNDLVRDMNLTKQDAELLGSRLREEQCLTPQTSFSWYRNRDEEYRTFFKQEDDLVYCTDIKGLIQMYNISYCKDEWSLYRFVKN